MDKNYLNERLRELGLYSEYYHRLELKTLAAFMPYDEKLNCLLTGFWSGSRRMVAITESRVIVIAAGALAQTQVMVIKRSAITGWKFTKKLLLSSAEIDTEEQKYIFAQTQGGREKLFNWAMEQPIKEYEE